MGAPTHDMWRVLKAREIDPKARLGSRGRGVAASPSSASATRWVGSHERELQGWAEGDSLRNCTATYCPLRPPPRSTIAAAFSPDGLTLASTQ